MYLNLPSKEGEYESEEQIPESEMQEVQERTDNIQQSLDGRKMLSVRVYVGSAYGRPRRHTDESRRSDGLSPFFFGKESPYEQE